MSTHSQVKDSNFREAEKSDMVHGARPFVGETGNLAISVRSEFWYCVCY